MTHSKSTKKNINDADFLKQMVQTYLQEYLEQEMALHLSALPYERNTTRKGYRNGYKPRQLNTRVGKLFLSLPQDRDGTFSTELFERYPGKTPFSLRWFGGPVRDSTSLYKSSSTAINPMGMNARIKNNFVSKLKDGGFCSWLTFPFVFTFRMVKPPCCFGYFKNLISQI